MNNLPYVMAVEKMAGIEVPERVKTIRIMLAEMFRYVVTCCFMEPLLKMWGNCHLYFICSLKGSAFLT